MVYDYTVVTYGGGWILTEIFSGIAAAVGSTSYLTMIGIASLFSFAWIICEMVFKQSVQLSIRWFIGFFLIYNLLLVPKVTVHIEDKIDQTQVHPVANVPWGLAEFASDITEIFSEVTSIADKVYSLPDDLRYTSSGTVMASSLVNAASQFSITDPVFATNMNEFMQQCVFYDLLLGKYSTKDLFETPDLWGFIKGHASPARTFRYGKNIMTCLSGAGQLDKDWNVELQKAGKIYGARFFSSSKPMNADKKLLEYLPVGYSYLTGISQSAEDIMQQNMVKNAIDKGVVNNAGVVNAPAALAQYAYMRSQQTKRALYQVVGEQAAYWLPIMKIVFEGILFGSFLFLAPLMLMPFGFQIFKNYIFALVWVESWAPLYAVLNLVMTVSAQLASNAAVDKNGQHVLSMMTLPGLQQANYDISYLAGYFSLSIPMIAYYITKGGAMGFMSLSQYMGGAIQSAASGAVAEETTGNLSFGNTSFGNHSAFNTNANHFDTNARIFSGGVTTQMPGGSTMTVTPGGATVMDTSGALSKLGVSMTVADSMRASFSQQADHADAKVQSDMYADAQSTVAAIRSLNEMGSTKSSTAASGESFNQSEQGGLQDSANQVHNLINKFAQSHNLSHDDAVKYMASAYWEAHGGFNTNKEAIGKIVSLVIGFSAGTSVGTKLSADHTWSHSDRQMLDEAKDFANSSGFNHQVDNANRAVHDQSFRTSHESTTRLGESISSSFDQSNQARHDMSVQSQQSESFRKAASIATDQSFSNATNLSQVFFDWVKDQPAPGSSGPMGANSVEYMMQNRPDLVRKYAEEFSAAEGNQLMDHYLKQSGGMSSQSISEDFKHNVSSIANSSDIGAQSKSNDKTIFKGEAADGFDQANFIDTSAKTKVNQFLKTTKAELSASTAAVSKEGNKIANENKEVLDPSQ